MHELLANPLALLVAQAIVIITVARVFGLAARRLEQPMVIAEIAAGIALGPSLLKWAWPAASAMLFPSNSIGNLQLLSQVGLLLFMFLVGLEFDTGLIRGRAHTSVAISHASIALPFGLGAALALYLYPRLADPAIPFLSFVLFMGVAMSITAFPVLARILVERRLLGSRVGAITIACAAVDDVTAWCILAFVVSIVRAKGFEGAILTTAFTVCFITVMLFGIRPLLRRIGERTRSRELLSQNRVAVVLVLVLASSLATEAIGVHALFGAFVLGAVIPKGDGFAKQLAEKLEDLVVVFLLPLFFAYSGLKTQIGLLNSAEDWAMCGAIVAVACAGKFGGSTLAARLTGMRWRESAALGVLMNTRGLMELVALNIGYDLGVISAKLFTMMVLMALITTFITTPLLELIYPLAELTRDLMKEPEAKAPPAEAASPIPGFTVLACIGAPGSGSGMVRLAAALGASETFALNLIRPSERGSRVLHDRSKDEAVAEPSPGLVPAIEQASSMGLALRPLSFVSVAPGRDICRVAAAKHAQLVVVGSHRPLLLGRALGGPVHEILQQAASDVAILVDKGLEKLSRVLVPYLGGEHDRAALLLAHRLACWGGAEITILHVVTPDRKGRLSVENNLLEFSEETFQGQPVKISLKLVESEDPSEAAVEESRNGYDLVAIGAGSQWGLEPRLLGIQSEYVVRHCPTSLLVIHDYKVAESARIRQTEGLRQRAAAELKALPGESSSA